MGHARITWAGDRQFVGTDSSKHSVVMSTQDEKNGTGMRPADLLLVALAGCTAVGVVDILQRKRQDLMGLEINISGQQNERRPKAYYAIQIEYVARGRGLKEKALTDAIRLSLEKYCPVSATIKGQVTIETSHQIIEV